LLLYLHVFKTEIVHSKIVYLFIFQMIERHLFLMMIEFLVILLVFSVQSYRRNDPKPLPPPSDRPSVVVEQHRSQQCVDAVGRGGCVVPPMKQPSVTGTSGVENKLRRRSTDGAPPPVKNKIESIFWKRRDCHSVIRSGRYLSVFINYVEIVVVN